MSLISAISGSNASMVLVIDSTDPQRVFVGQWGSGQWQARRTITRQHHQSEQLIGMIARLLVAAVPIGIAVVTGRGSFTATRMGVVVANGLGYGWQVPVTTITNDMPATLDQAVKQLKRRRAFTPVAPTYTQAPTITPARVA